MKSLLVNFCCYFWRKIAAENIENEQICNGLAGNAREIFLFFLKILANITCETIHPKTGISNIDKSANYLGFFAKRLADNAKTIKLEVFYILLTQNFGVKIYAPFP